jgi:polyhydroxyalkanoate synthesis regulator phasin
VSDNDVFKRMVDAGVAFTEMSRQRAEQIVGDLARRGEVSMEEVQASVEHLVERSRVSTDRLITLVRDEVIAQLRNLGVVPPTGKPAKPAAAPATVVSATPAKKAAAKKAPAKKAAAKKAVAKKAPAKRAGAAKR